MSPVPPTSYRSSYNLQLNFHQPSPAAMPPKSHPTTTTLLASLRSLLINFPFGDPVGKKNGTEATKGSKGTFRIRSGWIDAGWTNTSAVEILVLRTLEVVVDSPQNPARWGKNICGADRQCYVSVYSEIRIAGMSQTCSESHGRGVMSAIRWSFRD